MTGLAKRDIVWHEIRIEGNGFDHLLDKRSMTMINWCNDTCGSRWDLETSPEWDATIFRFQNKNDALNFAMTWIS